MSRPRLIGLLLALITLLVYLPASRDSFSHFDDCDYVTGNRVVQNGLTWVGVKWAFTTWYASNWHPVTWLSHMLDCELFSLNAGAQHYVNVLFHAANAVLLFLLLLRLTRELWPSLFVAELFAWHPLHVESVAWLSERKDVLSTFFALLTLLAYARYAQWVTSDGWPAFTALPPSPGFGATSQRGKQVTETEKVASTSALSRVTCHASRFYWLALIFFALGLMSKPMLVTLPFVMLLLDYWPLQRVRSDRWQSASVLRLLVEKWPFFVLMAVSCVVTFLAQRHGDMVVSLKAMPPGYRLAKMLLAYTCYLLKMIWPVHLAIFYPLPKEISPLAVSAAVVVLISITVVVWFGRKRSPYGLMGWLWFLGTLVPVIGLVQVGLSAWSDRYTYFPLTGIFIAMTFAVRDWRDRFKIPPLVITTAAILILGSCVLLTENQLACWRDDQALYTHAISVTKDNEQAHLCLGFVLEEKGRTADAIAEYRIGLKLNPYRIKAYNQIASLLAESGRTNEALAELREALRINSKDALLHNHLAGLLADSGRTNEALAEFREAVRINPKDAALYNNLGTLLVKLGRFDEAMEHYAAAARLDPTDWRAPYLWGKALLKQGRDLEALPYFRQAMQIDPDNLHVLIYLAQVLASDDNPKVRDGHTAFALASKANTLTGGVQPALLDVLGMACAELGRFDDAQKAAQEAINLAKASGMTNDAVVVQQRLRLYQNHQPWRESFLSTNPPPGNPPQN